MLALFFLACYFFSLFKYLLITSTGFYYILHTFSFFGHCLYCNNNCRYSVFIPAFIYCFFFNQRARILAWCHKMRVRLDANAGERFICNAQNSTTQTKLREEARKRKPNYVQHKHGTGKGVKGHPFVGKKSYFLTK